MARKLNQLNGLDGLNQRNRLELLNRVGGLSGVEWGRNFARVRNCVQQKFSEPREVAAQVETFFHDFACVPGQPPSQPPILKQPPQRLSERLRVARSEEHTPELH